MDNITIKREDGNISENPQKSDEITDSNCEESKTSEVTERAEEVSEITENPLDASEIEEGLEKDLETAKSEENDDEEAEKSVVISEPTEAMMEEMQKDDPNVFSNSIKGNNIMAFWRRGGMHVQNGTRCQDTAFSIGYDKNDPFYSKYAENNNKIKVIMDGCGSCEYSLLGVLMFEELFKRKATEIQINSDNLEDVVKDIFQNMLKFGSEIEFILNNYLFTILICFEYEDRFEVCTCGDGFILYVYEGQIFFKELEGSEKNEQGKVLPNYFAYDLDNVKGKLSNYKDGTEFELYTFGARIDI